MTTATLGWVIGMKDKVMGDCHSNARGYPMQSYRAEAYGRMSLLLLFSHYLRNHDIQPADDLRVTSYSGNSSLLTVVEEFQARYRSSAQLDKLLSTHYVPAGLSS